jgi:uncharacterized protein
MPLVHLKLGEAHYGKKHIPGMQVPEGGSNCAKCEYNEKSPLTCGNPDWIEWRKSLGFEENANGTMDLPMANTVYCCDWYEMSDAELIKAVTRNRSGDMAHLEIRQYQASEIRAKGGDGHEPLSLVGYAATFDGEAKIGGSKGYIETINPAAFDRALKENHDVTFRFNHNASFVLGRTKAGTLKLEKRDKGLWFECSLPETQQARDLHTSVQRGDISECSFAFSLPADGGERWSVKRDANGKAYASRELTDVDLYDVSAVTEPAYNNTKVFARDNGDILPVEMRSALEAAVLEQDIEARLYGSSKEVPDYVPADSKAQWKEVWNSAYHKAKKDGASDKDAEESAFKQANGVAGPNARAEETLHESTGRSEEKVEEPVKRHYSIDDIDDPDFDADDVEYNAEYGVSEEEYKAADKLKKATLLRSYREMKAKKAAAEKEAQAAREAEVAAIETAQRAERDQDIARVAEAVRVSMEAGLPVTGLVTEARFSDNPAHAVNHGQHAAAAEYHSKKARQHELASQPDAAEAHKKAAAAHQAVVDAKLSGASPESAAAREASKAAEVESKRCTGM